MKTYTIPKGEHYSMHLPKPYLGLKKEFTIKVLFDDSCRYDLGDIDQLDVNKLFGVSFGNHEVNSIRIGWTYNLKTQKIDLWYYCYENKIRSYGYMASVDISVEAEIDLILINNSPFPRFTIGIHTDGGGFKFLYANSTPYKFPDWLVGYYLFPYFGGNKVAPHTINIKLDVK